MANNRRCPNGHEYDATLYGDKCPFCPPSGSYQSADKTQVGGGYQPTAAYPPYQGAAAGGLKTEVVGGGASFGGGMKTQIVGGSAGASSEGETQLLNNNASEGRTVIRPMGGDAKMPAHTRRVVGLLVTYDHNPAGDVHRINEGVNTIGRASTNSIPVTADSEISAHHFNITFRPVDNAYFIRDEESVNGTFINDELLTLNTSRLLNNNDIIRAGKTRFVFLSIPRIDG